MAQKSDPAIPASPITTRDAVVAQLEACLSGAIGDAALAAWAFERFYAEELGAEQYEAGAESAIADVLDALMFGDDPSFRLDQEELRAMVAQLRNV